MLRIVQANLKEPAHADAILALLTHYALDPMGGGKPLSDYARKNLIPELSQRPDVSIVIAFDEQKPVGLVNCFEGFSTFQARPLMNIHDVVVHKDYRGQGVSSKMLREVERIARGRRCCKLTLEVLQGNRVAQAAYHKAGFRSYQLDPEMGHAMFWEKKL